MVDFQAYSHLSRSELRKKSIEENIRAGDILDIIQIKNDRLYNLLKDVDTRNYAVQITYNDDCYRHTVKVKTYNTVFEKNGNIYVNERKARRGWKLNLYDVDKVQVVPKKIVKHTFANLKARLYDDKTWTELKESDFEYQGIKFTNIKKKFGSHIIEQLQKAFRDKTDFSYRSRGFKRDLSVETKMGSDGIFRAWFSSEFSGCLNGSYYLLINPTTAVYMEDD